MNSPIKESLSFEQLDLHPFLLKAVKKQGFKNCTPVQEESLPIMLAGRDVAVQSQTGTGKTAAFLLAIMQRLLNDAPSLKRKKNQPRAIVISPTRELAIQIHKDAKLFNRYAGLSLALIYGGVDYKKQNASLSNPVDILIGTPGRLIDYQKQKVLNLGGLEVVILDEADRMFDLGFISDIRYMLRSMPKPQYRLSALFSATLPMRVTELASEHMSTPKVIKVNPKQVTSENVTQSLYHVANEEKIPLLLGLMGHIEPKRTIIFVNTKRVAEKVSAYLKGNDFYADVLSGDVHQKKRQRLFGEFSCGKLPILVATDLAARGLHVPDISHIFNYDLPQKAEDYVHRIGRTARAGKCGDSVSFACEKYVLSITKIEELIGHKIPVAQISDKLLKKPKPPVRLEKANPFPSSKRRSTKHSRTSPNRKAGRKRLRTAK